MPIENKDAYREQRYDVWETGADRRATNPPPPGLILRISQSLVLTRVARASAVAFILVTGTFFLLSSFVFSWLNIVRNENAVWIPELAHSYAYLYWGVLAFNAVTLTPAFLHRRSRWCTEAILILFITIGLLLTRIYSLYDLPFSFANLAWSVVLTLPLAGLGIHDFVMFSSKELWSRGAAKKDLPLFAAFGCGVLLAAWYFVIASLRYPSLRGHLAPYLPILIVACGLQACLFVCLEAVPSLVAHATRNIGPRLRLLAALGLIWICASLVLRRLVTPALSFNNHWADVWAWSYPFAFVVMLGGWHVRRAALQGEPVSTRVEEVLSGLLPEGRGWTVLAGAAGLSAAFFVPRKIEQVDWNFLFQRLNAVGVWILLFLVTWRLFARPVKKRYALGRNLACLALAAVCCLVLARSNRMWRRPGLKAVSQASSAYRGMDSSLQVAKIIVRPVIRDTDTTGFYPYLRSNALIADPIRPPALKLIESPLTPVAGPKPDIYIIVIDTLRRDYLSPYNPRVTFTPNIAAFARESIVFQHAFTNYGGTALSEPAIWAGMMIPSKQYVQPFPEMNALERLTKVDGYQRVFTADAILRRLLRSSPSDTLLNRENTQYFGLDFRDAVREIDQLPDTRAPRFVYTQPQNIHPLTLNRLAGLGKKVQGSYPGFYPRYAEELSKVDTAFGQFIGNLKARGKFENSIVILTSDHGDWLGEYGRWGHGYSLLPAVIEVPLLIHLPPNLAKTMYCNPQQEVFLTDITPSLLYLLGHRALRKGEFYGRPLFTETAEEQKDYARPYHFFMSSYAAVFGVMEEKTQTFYMVDAVDENQAVFDLSQDWYGLDNLIDSASQQQFERLTRGYIKRLNALYGYPPPKP